MYIIFFAVLFATDLLLHRRLDCYARANLEMRAERRVDIRSTFILLYFYPKLERVEEIDNSHPAYWKLIWQPFSSFCTDGQTNG
jgi:hypothetical protein